MVSSISSEPLADIAQCGYRKFGKINQSFTHTFSIISGNDAYLNYFNNLALTSLVWDKIYKKEIIGKLRFEVNKTMEDAIFLDILFSNKNPKVVVIPEILYMYRIRENSTMTRKFDMKHISSSFYQQNININICKEYYPHYLSKAYQKLYSDLLHYIQLYHKERLNISYDKLKQLIYEEIKKIEGHCGRISIMKLKILLNLPYLSKILFR